jgi:hypothetical protein
VKFFVSAALLAVMVVGAQAGSYLLSLHALRQSQAQLCTVFEDLTADPVPRPADPAANPSRERQYRWYLILRHVERGYQC